MNTNTEHTYMDCADVPSVDCPACRDEFAALDMADVLPDMNTTLYTPDNVEGVTYANDRGNRFWLVGNYSDGHRRLIWSGKTSKAAEAKRSRMAIPHLYEVIDRAAVR